MADLVRWVCRSPQRLVAVLGVTLVVTVAVGSLLLDQMSPSEPGRVTAATSADPKVRLPDSRPFVTAAVDFVRLWARPRPGQTAQQWRASLEPWVTTDLAAGLRLTDLRNLPGGQPQGTPVVRYLSVTSALIAVPLSGGSTVLVTVIASDVGSSPWAHRSTGDAGGGSTSPRTTRIVAPGTVPAAGGLPDRGPVADQGARPSYSLATDRGDTPAPRRQDTRRTTPRTTSQAPVTMPDVTPSTQLPNRSRHRWLVADVQPDIGDFGAP